MHDYMLPLAKLAGNSLKVVFYDQIGCGRSERPEDPSLFTIRHGVEEVEGVRRALNLDSFHLLGSSYGGQLALEYALKHQSRLEKLVVTGGYASVSEAVREMNRLKKQLPREIQRSLAKYERLWAYQHPEYLKALRFYYRKFFCRMRKWPKEVVRTLDLISVPVHWLMNGPDELTLTGNLRKWDITTKLPKIHVPTLITTGRYDLVSPNTAKTLNRGIPNSRLVVFEKSSHLPMWEERELYLKTVKEFIMN